MATDKQVNPFGIEKGKVPPCHKEYQRLKNEWEFYEDSYEGGCHYKDAQDASGKPVLVQHACESKNGFEARKSLSAYHNYPKAVVDRLCSYTFARPVVRDESLEEWSKDVGEGVTLQRFMADAMTYAATVGLVGILMDSTLEEEPQTLTAQKNGKIKLSLLEPCDVINWNCYRSVILISYDDKVCEVDDKFIYEWALDKGKVAVDQPMIRAHGWSSNPVIWMYGVTRDDSPSASLIGDVSEHARLLFNYCSWLTEELQKATFTQFVIAAPGLESDQAQKSFAQIPLGSRNWLVIPAPASECKWEAIGCDPAQADSLRQSIVQEVSAIYRTVGLQSPEAVRSSAESGVAIKLRLSEVGASANRLSENAEQAENRVLEMWSTASGTPVEPSQYPDPDDMDEGSLAEDLKEALDLVTRDVPAELKARVMSDWAQRKYEDAELTRVINEWYLEPELDENAPPDETTMADDGITAPDGQAGATGGDGTEVMPKVQKVP